MHRRMAAVCLLVLYLFTAQASAQPQLQLTHTWKFWPRIELHFKVLCGGVHLVNMTKDHFRLWDEGIEVTEFTLDCPPASSTPFSCALLFDASGSMAGTYQSAAIEGGRAFIDLMDGVQDEAAVYYFTETLQVGHYMTTRRDWLKAAVDNLPAQGATAIWDACYEAIEDVAFNAAYDCRSIILLTDGLDNSSFHTPEAIINAANLNNIHINIIGLGITYNTVARDVAVQTGGKFFYMAEPSELVSIYRELFTDLRFCYSECMIAYNRSCADGRLVKLDLKVEHFCDGVDVQTAYVQAPLDLGTYQTLDFTVADAYVQGGNEMNMTVWLRTPVDNQLFHPFSTPLYFDTSVLKLDRVTVPPGTLLSGVPLTLTPRADGALVTAHVKKVIQGTGPFMELHFKTTPRSDTLRTPMRLGDFWFDAGCLRSFSTTGEVTIFPDGPMPLVYCESLGPSKLSWDRMSENYLPNPFPVMARFINAGSVDAKEARFVLSFDSTVLRRVQPQQDTIIYAFADITPDSHAAVSWDLESAWRTSDLTTEVCILALFDNHPPVKCCTEIEIPRADGILRCTVDAPTIQANTSLGRYEPMPFPVTVHVRNVGGRPADNVTVRLQLPPEMELAGVDAHGNHQKSLPANPLPPGAEDSLTWIVSHPVIPHSETRTLTLTAQSPSTAANSCNVVMQIPGLDLSDFAFLLYRSGTTNFCAGDSVMLDAGAGRESYVWSTGDTTRRIIVHESGAYSCVVGMGGRTGTSDTARVVVRPRPAPRLAITGSLPLCPGDTVILDAGAGYATYKWNTTATTRSIVIARIGTFYCDVTDSTGCAGRSDSVRVLIAPRPDTPVIQRQGDLLTTTPAARYQWYRDSTAIPDSDNQFLFVLETGSYRVHITDTNGCSAWSAPFEVTVLNVGDLPASVRSFDVYPNPTTGTSTLILQLSQPEDVEITVIDVLGRAVVSKTWMRATTVTEELDFATWGPGVYLVRVRAGSERWSRKLIVNP
jgi:hypothetical protein